MKLSRRIMLIVASAALALGLLTPPASAGKPTPGKQPPSADLGLGIHDNRGGSAANYGDEIIYEVGFGNEGPSRSTATLDVTVSGGSVTSWSSGERQCSSGSDSELHCDLGSLAVGEVSTITVSVKPSPESLATGVTVEGNIYGPLPDPKPWTNSYRRWTGVQVIDSTQLLCSLPGMWLSTWCGGGGLWGE